MWNGVSAEPIKQSGDVYIKVVAEEMTTDTSTSTILYLATSKLSSTDLKLRTADRWKPIYTEV